MPFILGLDLGTNSIGWACIDANNEKVLGLGSRIFQEGVNRETKGKEISKNAIRRQARQSRKQYYRKRIRKEKLKIFLKNFGMFPDKKEGECEFFKLNPYCLRKRGLDEKLTKWEFGRILYHINQRRGFKSNRKSQKEKEDGVVKEATTQLQQEIKGNHCRTLGEYLALLNPAVDRIRKRYTLRKMYEEEFDLLWENQKEFHSDFSSEMKKKLKDEIIFYQGPLISVAKLIGPCSLEPTKKRTPKSSFEFQKYRILEQVNRLTFIDEDGVIREFFRSPDEEFEESIQKKREKLLAELYRKKDRDFSQIRKLLDLPKNTVFNLEKGGSKKLIGNRTEVQLSGLFGKTWWKFTGDQKEKIFQTIINAKDSEWLTQYAENKWGLGSEKAQQLGSKIHFESGYAHLSRKAIKNLLPHLENGLSFAGAKEKAGYGSLKNQRNIQEILENLRNPIVSQTLYELVRLLKVIEQNFGKPKMVRVELARELKLSADKRNKIQFENIDREKNNQRIREDLEQKRIKPTYDAVLRYKLWEECKETCPYTGAKISFADLFSETPQFQIEHIIPFPRSGDDSYMNKTLCRVDENERKGNRTPFEAYHGTEQFEQILRRLKDLHLPYPKQRKFQQKEIGEDFIKRQLNDTAYISRKSRELLQSMGYETRVTKGQATARLRHLWGLNTLLQNHRSGLVLKKNREDHRHHAIDAAVVALTDERTLHKLSAYNKYDRTPTQGGFTMPWTGFRENLESIIKTTLVSHRVTKRVRGRLHEETFYGSTGLKDEKNIPLYAVRKPLTDLKQAMIEKIADPEVKKIIKNHLRSLGIDPDQKKFDIPSNAFKETTLYMKTTSDKKIPIKKVRIHNPSSNMVLLPKLNKTGVEPGNNHHIVLYQYQDAKGNLKQGGEICTLFEAVRRLRNNEPLIRRKLGEGKTFLISLAINEMVLLNMKESEINWNKPDYETLSKNLYRVQKISSQITLRHHLVSNPIDKDGKEPGIFRPRPSSFRGIKVRVDRIGRIYKAHD